MKLRILKAGKTLLDADVSQVTLPAKDGQMTAMDGHDRLLGLMNEGRVDFIRAGAGRESMEHVEISRGVAEVLHDSVTLFVEDAGGGAEESLPDKS